MNKKKILLLLISVVILATYVAKKVFKKDAATVNSIVEKNKENSYWTCPMHPEVHLDHAGECPICHMKLIKVTAQVEQTINGQTSRSSVIISSVQSQLLGVQKHTIEKMDLQIVVPVSGRIISSSSVAFQIYEDDLRYIKPGLFFDGTIHEEIISGIVTSVDTIADPISRTVRIGGSIKNGPRNLILETSFRGTIKIDRKDVIAIPESSVLHTGTDDLVYVFTSDKGVSAKAVQLGMKAQGFYEVLSGIEAGTIISSGPNFLIDSEAKIRAAQ